MPFLSTLLNRPVADLESERVGKLEDLVAGLPEPGGYPPVVAIVVRRNDGSVQHIAVEQVAALVAPAIALSCDIAAVTPFTPGEQHFLLAQDMLDKQLIDTNDIRVVRVNDLELARVSNQLYLANVDIGGAGLLRRMGWPGLAQRLQRRKGGKEAATSASISWHDVEFLPGDDNVRLRVPSDKIGDLHPADLAEIIHDLSPNEGSRLLESLDVKTVADALEEVEPEFQASLVESMTDDRVADVLEEMAPDEAADLLAELSQERSELVLSLMQVEEARDVRKLLSYPDDSAGGIMNTEFVALGPELTAGQVLQLIRTQGHEAETMYYLYVVDPDMSLRGVFSLRELVLAAPDEKVRDIMHNRVKSVRLTDSQDDVAQAVSKYNLLAVPVVDDEGRLHGIVTADDALDKIIPTSWKKRLPRFYH
ncbi:MAG: magnesium transporter [Fimbriimonadaceae bacterium]|nr:magnesium transporter [Fimbriimonadaceae bacterium]